jgi:histidinol-phosphate/aromatic aminotransferase/cobyric acid decarboxylase-like protein
LALALLTPPRVVGLPAQVAAVRALQDAASYQEQYKRTHLLGVEVHEALLSMGIREIVPGEANFLMFHLDESQLNASQIIDAARREGVFVRDIASMGSELGSRASNRHQRSGRQRTGSANAATRARHA